MQSAPPDPTQMQVATRSRPSPWESSTPSPRGRSVMHACLASLLLPALYLPLLHHQHPGIMSEQDDQLSDADKVRQASSLGQQLIPAQIRLKRLARLAGPPASASGSTTPAQTLGTSPPASAADQDRPAPAAAASRLLSANPAVTSQSGTTQSSPSVASTARQASTPDPKGVIGDLPKRSNVSLGKRPAARIGEATVGPRIVAVASAQSLTPETDYATWETGKVGQILSVTLEVDSQLLHI